MPTTTEAAAPKPSKTDTQAKLLNRLKRIEGQVRGLQRMIEEERDCREVLTQLSGVRSALDAASDVILETYLEKCAQGYPGEAVDPKELLATLRLARR
ncbi:metal-sensitive transcriptional regulator [Truepera radiovictrix]|nr:metal-sensitive transcriptional regulator [Truepera radiovictrix]WMT58867.1 metal-sensitive transcriptional regulator [Truepera radiovictrix]